MIAPFWSDVDTRGALSGLVYYQQTSTHLIVQWDGVGYYDSHDDKANHYQLVITDGTDAILPPVITFLFVTAICNGQRVMLPMGSMVSADFLQ
ncbi:MAG: hypothetical protein IPP51_16780 [Bacteroidetes bacterium]|nr:hypothetical protein [Bacteroidota bacterium]